MGITNFKKQQITAMPGPKAKKATPTKAAKSSGSRYNYSLLNNVSVTTTDRSHVYGVVVDATFPYKVSKDRFVCSLKIVDGSLNGSGKKNDWANLVIFATRFEDLPIVHRLGDIIRVHRATMRVYEDRRQFNVNTQTCGGAWALFSTDKQSALGADGSSNAPIAHCGKRASFEKQEANILSALRKWAAGYMAGANPVTAITPLNKASSVAAGNEFDEYTNERRLRDASGESWYTLCTKLKFPHLRNGQTIYIRSVTANASSGKKVLAQSHYSNVCTFIGGSKAAANCAKVTNDNKADADSLKGSNTNTAVVVSEVAAKYSNMAVTSLRDLFHRDSTLSGNTFRVHVQCTGVNSANSNATATNAACGDGNLCRNFNNGKSTAADGSSKNVFWQAELLCKDASTANSSNQYRLLNYSQNGLGANFFGKAAAGASARVAGQVRNMTRFNSFVDAIVERSNGFYYIKDTRLVH